MNWLIFLKYLAVMAVVTYLIRVLPYVFMRKEVNNRFFKSFLAYVPYTVLAAMTIPAILAQREVCTARLRDWLSEYWLPFLKKVYSS